MAFGRIIYKLALDTREYLAGSDAAARANDELAAKTTQTADSVNASWADMATGANQALEIFAKVLSVLKEITEESERQSRAELSIATQATITGTSLSHAQAVQSLSTAAGIPERAIFDIREGFESRLKPFMDAKTDRDLKTVPDPILSDALSVLGIDPTAYTALDPEGRDQYLLDRITATRAATDQSQTTFALGEVFAGDSEDAATLAWYLAGTGSTIATEQATLADIGIGIDESEVARSAQILRQQHLRRYARDDQIGETAQDNDWINFVGHYLEPRTIFGFYQSLLTGNLNEWGERQQKVNISVDPIAGRAGVVVDVTDAGLNDEISTPDNTTYREPR